MGPEALHSAYRPAALVVILGAAAAALVSGLWARDFLFAGLWSVVNLRAWHGIIESALVQRRAGPALAWAALKLPLLFGLGFLYLVRMEELRLSALLLGFHAIFAVFVIRLLTTSAPPRGVAGPERGE